MSDRIEKEAMEDSVVRRLETGGMNVVRGDWRKGITIELQDGRVLIVLHLLTLNPVSH